MANTGVNTSANDITEFSYEYDCTHSGFDSNVPRWLQGTVGSGYLGSFGRVLDIVNDSLRQAVLARVVRVAPVDGLQWIARERNMPRYPGDTDATWRARLELAWPLWQFGGTAQGILTALASAGFTNAAIFSANQSGPPAVAPWPPTGTSANWSRFAVYLDVQAAADNPFSWASVDWGDFDWGDGTTWGSTATTGEIDLVRGIIALWKAAHEICPWIYVKLPDGTLLRWQGPDQDTA